MKSPQQILEALGLEPKMRPEHFAQRTGRALNVERVSLGLTQFDVALALGVEVSTVSRWESGERELRLYDWAMLEQCFAMARKGLAARLMAEAVYGSRPRPGTDSEESYGDH